MSDFLSRLADKATGRDGPVRPRLRSYFEPERIMPGAGFGWLESAFREENWAIPDPAGPEAAERDGERTHPRAPAPGRRASAHPAATGEQAGPAMPRSAASKAAAVPSAPAGQPSPPQPARAAQAAGSEHVPARPPSPAAPRAREPGAVPPRTGNPARPLRPRADTPISEAAPIGEPGGAVSAQPPQHLAARVASPAAPAWPGPPAAAAPPGIDAPPVVATGDAALAPWPLPARAGPRAAIPGPDPVINITIGRIEVRAAPARGSERRAGPAASGAAKPLSLEDYLHRREVSR
jgi:hypothetical protein